MYTSVAHRLAPVTPSQTQLEYHRTCLGPLSRGPVKNTCQHVYYTYCNIHATHSPHIMNRGPDRIPLRNRPRRPGYFRPVAGAPPGRGRGVRAAPKTRCSAWMTTTASACRRFSPSGSAGQRSRRAGLRPRGRPAAPRTPADVSCCLRSMCLHCFRITADFRVTNKRLERKDDASQGSPLRHRTLPEAFADGNAGV